MYEESADKPIGLAPKTSAEFLNLFLQGYTAEEVQKLNPGFKLGIIVKARVDHEWDRHKKEYIDTLMNQTRETVQKTQLEGIRLATDAMAVHQKVLGTAFKKYLQTGNEEDLGVHRDQINLRNLKEWTALMMNLTGQDKKMSESPQQTAPSSSSSSDTARTVDVAGTNGSDLLKYMDK